MIKVVSLFSGAGGMDLGFINAGFEIVWANDFEKAACDTYKKNIGDHIVCGDITNIKVKDIPDCDVVIGGSPCQGFSNSNRTTNFLDNPKNFLVREFIRVVKGKKPKVFVLENVPQILTAGDGQFIDEIKKVLKEYHITTKVLHSEKYGVAQKRKRAIIIGSKIGEISHPEPNGRIVTLREALAGITEDTPNQIDYSKSDDLTVKRMSYVEQGSNWKDIPEELRKKWTHSSMYRRLSLNEPSTTIVNFRKTMLTHPTENRIISVREAARIQGFSDDFIFYGTLAEKQQMVANAVPVKMAEAIANKIMKHMHNTVYIKEVS